MERDEIVRSDFPTARKGWSPAAVEAHLNAVADSVAASESKLRSKATPAADAASERVGAILSAAESSAAEIVEDAEEQADRIVAAARAEADQIRAAARTESEETVSAASREARGRVEQAQAAVEGLVAQADRLRAQVGALGRDLAASVPGFGSAAADEPEAPAEREEPEDVAEDAAPSAEGVDAPASGPEGSGPTDEELIARLRAGSAGSAEEPAPGASGTGPEHGAARLVAMNMALDGTPRDEIAERIEAEFGDVGDVDGLLDDVLRRASR